MKTFILILSVLACVLGGDPALATGSVPLPDLAPLSVAAATNQVVFDPPSPQAPSVAVICVVTNEGLAAAVGEWSDVIWISTNGTMSGIIGSQTFWNYYWYLPGVPSGGTYDETDSVSLPEQSGTYWLIFQANASGYLYEADTTNNMMVASAPVTVTYQVVPPDLAPVSVAAATNRVVFDPPSPQAPSVAVTCVVTNEGLGDAEVYWNDVISISTNGTTSGIISSQAFWSYDWDVPPDGTYDETESVSLPEESGTYWLIFQANAYGDLYEPNTNNNTMVASVPVTLSYQVMPPDLAPLSFVVATNRVVFDPTRPQAPSVAVTCVVTNEGLGAAVGEWYDIISISTNGTTSGIISSQSFWNYYWYSPGIPSGGSYDESDYVSLPEQSGKYWLIFQVNAGADLYEPDTTNNTMLASVPVTVTYQVVPPDLAPVSVAAASNHVAFHPSSPQAPTVPVTWVVSNKGRGTADGDWDDVISISTNATTSGIISSQAFWQYQDYGGVPPGGIYRETNTVSLPQQTGKYWLVLQANAYGDLYEADTANNTMVASVPVTVTYQVVPPDLAPVSAKAASNQVTFNPPSPQAPTVPVICVVTNEGLGAAIGSWDDMISISTNGTASGIISSQDFWTSFWNAPGVPFGGTYEETNVVSLPEQSGTYWLIFQANADGYLYEVDTTNNTMAASTPVTVTYQVVPPDLAPLSVTAASNQVAFYPTSPQAPSVEVICVVTNEGLGAAVGFWDDVILISTNGAMSGIINSQAFWNYYWDSPGVPSGGTYDETASVSLPEQSGNYWLIFQVNPDGFLMETDTTNNTMAASVPVTVTYQVVPPDLAPVSVTFMSNSVTFDPSSPQSASVPVVCLVTNEGLGDAVGSWYDTISVSTNGASSGIISSENIWEYWYPQGLPPGGAYQQTNYVSLPEQSGTYWVLYQANAYGDLYESDTTNNTMISPAPVTLSYQVIPPDLAPVSVTATTNYLNFDPASPQAPTVPVTCVVTNQGLGAVMGYWYDMISISTNGTTNGIISSQEFAQYQDSPGVPSGGAYDETDDVSLPEQSGTYWLIFQANADGGLYEPDASNNTMIASAPVTVSYQVIPPDLAPVGVTPASNHVSFDPASPQPPTIPVICVVTNEGPGTAMGGWNDVISISTNGTMSGIISSQEFWQNEYSPGVPPGGTYDETDSVSLPEQSGTYWLIFQANAYGDLYEADATNNTLIDSTPVTLSYRVVPPDLAPLSVVAANNRVAFYPPSPQAPTVPVACVVKNNGRGTAAGAWYDMISISTNATISGIISSQQFWQNQYSPGVPFGGIYDETNGVSLPEQSGTYWLIFQANADGYLYEANLANNVMIASVPVKVTYQVIPPDLVPLSIAAASNEVAFSAANPQSQATLPVVCAVKNQGLGAAVGYWYDTVSVSTNGTINGIVSSQDFWVDWSSVPLPPDGVYQETNYVTLPGQSGTYWLILQVNNYNYLYEPNTTNNTMIAPMPVTVTTQLTPPDLAPVNFMALSNNVAYYPPSPQASLAAPVVPVVYTVTNLGPGIALGNWYDTVWVSTNSTLDGIVGGQDFYEDLELPGLPPGGTYQRTNTVTLPAQNGTYWLIFQANDYNYLYEADTTNNTMTAPVPVSVTVEAVTPPDLAPVSVAPVTNNLEFYPPSPWAQPAIAVVYTVTNQGLGAAMGGWYDMVWVSTNSTADGIVGSQSVNEYWDPPGLLPGESYQRINMVTLPAQNGTYRIILQANNYNYLYEADTNNNTMTSSVPISLTVHPATLPDLAPVKLAALSNNVVFVSPNPQSPPSVPVVYAVTNDGLSEASGRWYDVVSVSTNASAKGIISSQYFFESWDFPGLPPGGTYQRTNDVTLPAQSGKYWLIFQADASFGLDEADLTNNTLIASAPVTLTCTIQPPDLAPVSVAPLTTNLSFYTLLPESTGVAVRCVVTNKGAGLASGAWYDCVYVSTNKTIKGAVSSQLFEVQPTGPGLPPGGVYQETNFVWLPQQSGKYWLIFQANDYALLYEPNTANNTLAAPMPVTLTYSLAASPGPVIGMLMTSNYAVSATSSTMAWTWSPTTNASGYQVGLDQFINGAWQAPMTNQTAATGYIFTGITPDARCEISVSAINAAGAGPISTNWAFAALPGLQGLSVRTLTSSSVVFQIVPCLSTNYSVGGYYVSGDATNILGTGPGPSVVGIEGLRPGTDYAFYLYQYDWVNNLNGPLIATNISTLSSPGGWTPAQFGTNVSLWLDAANASTLVLNGNHVKQWTDLSGGGNNVTNSIAATQPTYQTNGINNRPAVCFTAAGMGLFGAKNFGVSGSAPRTLAAVMDCGLVGTGTPVENEGFGFEISTADAEVPYFYNSGDVVQSRPPFAKNAGLFFGEYGNGGGQGYVSGAFFGSNGVVPNTLPGPIQLGKRSDGDTRTGKISEIVYLSTGLSAPQRHQLEGYLAWKWGLQGSLPTNHPYRNAAPLVPFANIKAGYLPAQGVQLQVSGLPAYQYIVLSATDLTANATWVPIATNTAAADGTWFFTDTNNCTQPARYYRAMVNLP